MNLKFLCFAFLPKHYKEKLNERFSNVSFHTYWVYISFLVQNRSFILKWSCPKSKFKMWKKCQMMSNSAVITLNFTFSKIQTTQNYENKCEYTSKKKNRQGLVSSVVCTLHWLVVNRENISWKKKEKRKCVPKNCSQSSANVINNIDMYRHKWWRGILLYNICLI